MFFFRLLSVFVDLRYAISLTPFVAEAYSDNVFERLVSEY